MKLKIEIKMRKYGQNCLKISSSEWNNNHPSIILLRIVYQCVGTYNIVKPDLNHLKRVEKSERLKSKQGNKTKLSEDVKFWMNHSSPSCYFVNYLFQCVCFSDFNGIIQKYKEVSLENGTKVGVWFMWVLVKPWKYNIENIILPWLHQFLNHWQYRSL